MNEELKFFVQIQKKIRRGSGGGGVGLVGGSGWMWTKNFP